MKSRLLLKIALAAAGMLTAMSASATQVTFYSLDTQGTGLAYITNLTTNERIQVPAGTGSSQVFDLTPGNYRLTAPYSNKTFLCSFDFRVGQPSEYGEKGKIITLGGYAIYSRFRFEDENGKKYYAKLGEDFTIENVRLLSPDGKEEVRCDTVAYRYNTTTYPDPCGFYLIGPKDYIAAADFVPTAKHPDYMTNHYTMVIVGNFSNKTVSFYKKATFSLSFPSDAKGEVTYKNGTTNYVPFIHVEPDSTAVVSDTTTYYYTVPESSQQYCYRVSRGEDLTHAGLFTPKDTKSVVITDAMLKTHDRHYCAHDVYSENRGTNYADIYLNINKRNLLRMKSGENFQIVNLRTWQLTNNSTSNYFVEPDYSWTVLNTDFQPDQSVVGVDDKGMLTAKKPGTAIVQVRYSAISLPAMNSSLWDEIWAENTGTFVVTVDADESSAPADNIRLAYKPDNDLDAEHDILYYMKGLPGYELTFTPSEGTAVTVANPLVDSAANTVSYPKGFSSENVSVNPDGSVTALLTFGRNIIRTTDAAGNANYQVLSAKPAGLEIMRTRDDDYILPGDALTMQFSGLYHVAGKLASIYNSSCHIKYGDITFNDGIIIGSGQYDFAGNPAAQQFAVNVPDDRKENIVMENGCLNPQGYGFGPGAHRAIRYDIGLDPNFNAGVVSGQFGSLPKKVFEVTPLDKAGRLKMTLPLGNRIAPVSPSAIAKAFGDGAHWVSADESVAMPADNGLIAAKGAGKVIITLVNDFRTRASEPLMTCEVTVPDDPNYVGVTGVKWTSEGDKIIGMNFSWGNWGNMGNELYSQIEPSNATYQTVIYTSSNPDAVAVGKKTFGRFETTGNRCPLFWNDATRASGEAIVTVTTLDGGYSDSKLVRFMKYADSITTDTTSLTLEQGSTFLVEAKVSPADASYPVIWTSDNEEVATVDDGLITARGIGEATIKASVENRYGNATASVRVTVVEKIPVGIDKVEETGFVFWPNPCQGTLYVRPTAATTAEIYSLDGVRVFSACVDEGLNALDLSSLSAGMYIIRMAEKTEKLIIK